MHNVITSKKGFSVKVQNASKSIRKELTPLQKKCLDVLLETDKLLAEAVKHEEVEQMATTLYQIISLQNFLPDQMRTKNTGITQLQLKALKEYLEKVDSSVVPRVFLKTFLAYRKRIIEHIGRV